MKAPRTAITVLCFAAALIAALILRHALTGETGLAALTRRPVGVMGTKCKLTAVAPRAREAQLAPALDLAEEQLRAIESRMSAYLALSELSRLNAAGAGQAVRLSPETLTVLRLAKTLHRKTNGAFDVTCLPVFRLWTEAGGTGRPPADDELAAARAACGWDKLVLLEDGARKTADAAGVGLGGIAKGYAIDRAVDVLAQMNCAGGLVDVGGDIRCFGSSPRGGPWRVAVRNPFNTRSASYFGTLELAEGAVCTSGNYERFVEIDGRRYSHIVDPRTGRPVDFAPSVTVVAPTAATADGWATALSVLGEEGLALIPPASRIEAMIVLGGPSDYRIRQTPGFSALLVSPIPAPPGTRPGTRPTASRPIGRVTTAPGASPGTASGPASTRPANR